MAITLPSTDMMMMLPSLSSSSLSSSMSSCVSREASHSFKKLCVISPEVPSYHFLTRDLLGYICNFLNVFDLVMMLQVSKAWQIGVGDATTFSLDWTGLDHKINLLDKIVVSCIRLPFVNHDIFCGQLLRSLQSFKHRQVSTLIIGEQIPHSVVSYMIVTCKPKHLTLSYDINQGNTIKPALALCANHLKSFTLTSCEIGMSLPARKLSFLFDHPLPHLLYLAILSRHIRYHADFNWKETFPSLQTLAIYISSLQEPKEIGTLSLPHLKTLSVLVSPREREEKDWPAFSEIANTTLCNLDSLTLQAPGSSLYDILLLARLNLLHLSISGDAKVKGFTNKNTFFLDLPVGPRLITLELQHLCLSPDDILPSTVTGLKRLSLSHITSNSMQQKPRDDQKNKTFTDRLLGEYDIFPLSSLLPADNILKSLTHLTLSNSVLRDFGNNLLDQLVRNGCKVIRENAIIFT